MSVPLEFNEQDNGDFEVSEFGVRLGVISDDELTLDHREPIGIFHLEQIVDFIRDRLTNH